MSRLSDSAGHLRLNGIMGASGAELRGEDLQRVRLGLWEDPYIPQSVAPFIGTLVLPVSGELTGFDFGGRRNDISVDHQIPDLKYKPRCAARMLQNCRPGTGK